MNMAILIFYIVHNFYKVSIDEQKYKGREDLSEIIQLL